MSDLNNPHDKFFKEVFTRREEAALFVRGVDNATLHKIIPESLELDPNSYIENNTSHHYRLTEERMIWLFFALFNLFHFVNPLLSEQIKSKQKSIANNPSALEQAYSMIDEHKRIIMNELGIAA